ncbi:MAG: hypothetical protein ACYDDF_13940 [Thermoplasmatota archaeon]
MRPGILAGRFVGRSGARSLLTRGVVLVLLAAFVPMAGCFEIPAGNIPTSVLHTLGWVENTTADQSQSDPTGIFRTEVRVYEHAAQSGTYGGHLFIETTRAIFAPSAASLRDAIETRVRDQAQSEGIDISGAAHNGSRTNGDHRSTQWFTFSGNATSSTTVFTANSAVRVVGEVWDCPEDRVVVAAVGLAQVDSVQTIGGIPVTTNPSTQTWDSIIADPSASIEGVQGNGLLYNAVCSS